MQKNQGHDRLKACLSDECDKHQIAKDYYSGPSIFYCKNWRICSKWLLSLPAEHILLIREIRCNFDDIGPRVGELTRELNLLRALIGFCEFVDRLEGLGLYFGPESVFKMCYRGIKIRQYPTFKANGEYFLLPDSTRQRVGCALASSDNKQWAYLSTLLFSFRPNHDRAEG